MSRRAITSRAGHECVQSKSHRLVAFLIALLVGMPSVLLALPAHALDGGPLPAQDATRVEVTLNQVVPTVVQPGQAWAVQGRVENASDATVELGEVQLLTAYRALDTTAEIDGWMSGEDDIETTRLLGSAVLGRPLGPGQGRDFYIVMAAGDIDPPFAFASLPLLLDVTAGDGVPLGELRTVLPWFTDSTVENPLDVSWVVPLTVPPDPDLNTETGPERTRAWLNIVGEDSPARAWLDGLSAYNATFVIDPSLLVPLAPAADVSAAPGEEPLPLPEPTQAPEPATEGSPQPNSTAPPTASPDNQSADPDVVLDDLGTSTGAASAPETGPSQDVPPVEVPDDLTTVQEAEVDLQRQLTQLDADHTWWLPVADPDVSSMIDLDLDSDVVDGVLGAPLPPSVLDADRLIGRGRSDIAWPMWSIVTQEQLSELRDLSPSLDISTALLPRSTFTDADGRNAETSGVANR